jgi:serine/threonine protein kinase
MAILSGTKLGSYQITAPIGAGGMGEVYQAHDTKLGRDVAIKVLREAFARDADRLSRFQREAKMLASLNHPTSSRSSALNFPTAARVISSWSWLPARLCQIVSSETEPFQSKKRFPLRSR